MAEVGGFVGATDNYLISHCFIYVIRINDVCK